MAIAAGATAASAWLMKPILDDVFLARDETVLTLVPLAVLAVFAIKGAATYAQAILMNRAGLQIVADIQRRLYRHLIHADLAFFQNTSTGTLIARFTNDTQMLRGATSSVLTAIVRDSLTLVALLGVLIFQDWQLALIALVIFPVAILPVRKIGRRMRKVSTSTQREVAEFTTHLDQTFQGARHVKAYTMEEHEANKADTVIEKVFRLFYKAERVRSLNHPLMETLGGVAIAVIIFYGGARVIEGATTPGTFFSFITALLMAYAPAKSLATLNASLQEGLAAAYRVFSFIDIEPEIRDRPGAPALKVTDAALGFENVSFSYHPEAPALRAINLEARRGQTIALVGPSGSGKSTLLNLIPRFYEPDEGRITIDGQDIRDVTLRSLRQSLSLVSQEVALFDNTIRANIAYGRETASFEEIEAAARRAAADDFIRALPDGYDTFVGEMGVRLSGGQRQRISIARAILNDAPILLLDEATSSLDTESERLIQAGMEELMRGRTTVLIAHRLSTVQHADLICVLDKGEIVERGTHSELLASGGAYARLYALQFRDGGTDTGEVALGLDAAASPSPVR